MSAQEASDRSGLAVPASVRYARTVTLREAEGLHARPAAELVKIANGFAARVTLNGKDARSLIALLSLGLAQGASLEIASEDGSGREAVDALVALIASDSAAEAAGCPR